MDERGGRDDGIAEFEFSVRFAQSDGAGGNRVVHVEKRCQVQKFFQFPHLIGGAVESQRLNPGDDGNVELLVHHCVEPQRRRSWKQAAHVVDDGV